MLRLINNGFTTCVDPGWALGSMALVAIGPLRADFRRTASGRV